jgi:mannosylglycerate hydrolase
MPPRRVAVIPHTHWDREWYDPFETFRMRLVETLDFLLDLLESDPSYARFLLDGQMAVVDDYLEIRPHNAERLRRLCAAGRVAVGPWYILMDEFLVSGETIVRNLQRGMRSGAAFGGVSEVGYLPDMFGHVAQMPQILRLAGFEHAVVWRGVPSEITTSGFWWHAPDGSTVRAEYLLDGYGNGASLPDDAKAVVAKVNEHVEQFSSFLLGDVLFMNGSDHLSPQPFLGRVVAEANALQDDFDLVISSLREHLDRAPTEGLGEWTGELRSGFRANVLMGVASNHVDVKVAAAMTEESIERRAEPLTAMFVPADRWPTAFLDVAWREVIRNAAHDSICACSVDDVILAVLHRFSEARQIGEGLASRALQSLGDSMRTPGYVVANSSARSRAGVLEVVLLGDELDETRVQVVSERTALPGELVFDSSTARTLLGLIQGTRLDDDAWIQAVDVEERDDEVLLTVKVGAFEQPGVALDAARTRVTSLLEAKPGITVRVRLEQPTIRRVLARTEEVQGLGWRRFSAAKLASAVSTSEGPVTLTNGLVTVTIDPDVGTFSIDGVGGFGRLVDDGDLGDSYNYSPPGTQSVVDAPTLVTVELVERGPVRATAVVTSTYLWPQMVDPVWSRRIGEERVEVTTTIQVVADERLVRVTTSFVNPSRDHRLRVHFPIIVPATGSVAECAFGTVARGLTAEGRPGEFGLPTFPSRRFVQAGGVTVMHRGLHEYELVDVVDGQARELAITLLRATGMLSRLGMTLRPMPAGPLIPVEGLQLVGSTITAHYAIGLDIDDPYSACTDVLTPLELVAAAGGGTRDDEGASITVEGGELSSLQIVDGLVELRVFNPRPDAATAVVRGRRGWEVDLRGLVLDAFEERVELRGFGITTLRLAADG